MQAVKEAIYQELHDDSTLQALMTGHTATPWGIFYHHLNDDPSFPVIVYSIISQVRDASFSGRGFDVRNVTVSITIYDTSPSNLDAIGNRVCILLDKKKGADFASAPATGAEINYCYLVNIGPELYDEDNNVHHKAYDFLVKARRDFRD